VKNSMKKLQTTMIFQARTVLGVFGFLAFACISEAQQITIASPASGAMFSAGQTINVSVSVTNGQVFAVQVGAQDIGFTSYQTQTPYSFTLTVPSNTIGPKNIFAVGLIANETVILSPVISVDVEPSSQPTSIAFQQSVVTFGYVGQQRKVGITATFADGSALDISQSTQVVFSSGNSSVVTVNPTGVMTAQGPGNTTVTASYGTLSATLNVIGPTGVKGDLNGDGVVNSDDLLLLETMLGSTLTGPNDARDLNGDGQINNLDVQALLSICGSACPSLSATTTNLSASTNQTQFVQPVTLTATVSGGSSPAPTGSVSFVVDGNLQDINALNASNQASIVVASLPVGSHVITALYDGDSSNAPSASPSVSVQITAVPGDVNSDGVVNCADLAIVKASFGIRKGQPGFDPRADVNKDGIVNVLDLSTVARQVPAGTTCP